MELVWPAAVYLAGYVDALERGWSPNTERAEASQEELALIKEDAAAFVKSRVDREAKGPAIVLPGGGLARRLPGYTMWMWDGEFCGSINFRWQPGTTELPPTCPGHIGYAVVPWKRGRGYATEALRQLLLRVREEGLPFVELTTGQQNVASQRVLEKCGARLVERFERPAELGGGLNLRFRIRLGASHA